MTTKSDRRTEILQALAAMLESSPGARITTAALAKKWASLRRLSIVTSQQSSV